MSFELQVFVHSLPPDLALRWEQMLSAYGLVCQFYPNYHPTTWHDCFAPIHVTVRPGAFPTAHLYGSTPLLSEIDLEDVDILSAEYSDFKTSALKYVPPHLYAALEMAQRCIVFNSSAGRTPLAFRLQCFTAATLAAMSKGILLDPQVAGGFFVGEDAIHHATQLCDTHDQRTRTTDWKHEPFTIWSAWDGQLPALDEGKG